MPPAIAHRPYQAVLKSILVVWLIVAAGSVAWKWYAGGLPAGNVAADAASEDAPAVRSPSLSIREVVALALSSGIIAVVAAVPGWLIVIPAEFESPPESIENTLNHEVSGAAEPTRESTREPSAPASPVKFSARDAAIERLGQAFLVGMMIRMAGTVALFLAGSYSMKGSPTEIGIWVLAWHLVLLFPEVITLSRQIPVTRG